MFILTQIEDDDNDDDDIDVDINYSICETNLNWQDECQISEQQINQNTNQFDDGRQIMTTF